MRRTMLIAGTVVSTLVATAGPAAAAAPRQRFFLSPSGNISCEIDLGLAGRTDAYCQTAQPGQSATLGPDGQVKICRGVRCIGNPPEHDPTLAYGDRIQFGPFTCTSSVTGVRCTASESGRGFLIRRAGIARV